MQFLISALLFAVSVVGGISFGQHQALLTPVSDVAPKAGATLPSATAVFETSLASPITSSATTLTLAANEIRGGGALSGYNCFTIDEGSAQAETVCGTVASTAVTSLARGISQSTGTTTVAALQFSHRRGANVKITDYPIIQILKAQNNGEDTFPNKLQYTSHPTFLSNTDIVDKKYVDDVTVAGAPDAGATTKGVVEKASGAEAAASAADGSGNTTAPLALTSSIATSSCQVVGNYVIVASSTNGKLDGNCFNPGYSYTFSSTQAFNASTSLNATTTIAASATTSKALVLNTVPYQLPSTRGASSTVLTEDGGGGLKWLAPTWDKLAEVISGSTATATVSNIPSRKFLRVVIQAPSITVAGGGVNTYLQFNADTGTNYNFSQTSQATNSNGASVNTTRLMVSAQSGAAFTFTFDIMNQATIAKSYSGTGYSNASSPTVSFFGGGWTNTSNAISSISFGAGSGASNGAGTIAAGTIISVYGHD